jgi:hypothetical protein
VVVPPPTCRHARQSLLASVPFLHRAGKDRRQQEKTGERVPIRVHRDLAIALKRAPRRSKYILSTKTGRKYCKVQLSKDIRARLIAIGQLTGKYVLHGLRKAAGVAMAEAGAEFRRS